MRDTKLFIKDIISAISAIEQFVDEMNLEQLKNDDKTASAVVRKFEIIGEASKNIPVDVKERYPEIPWKTMSGMRDRLIHAYFGIDFNLIWDAIKNEIPELKIKLQKILQEL